MVKKAFTGGVLAVGANRGSGQRDNQLDNAFGRVTD